MWIFGRVKTIYLGIEAVSCRLLLRDSKGAHGLNLEKKLSFFFFFKVLMLCSAKNTKKVLRLLLSVKICLKSSS